MSIDFVVMWVDGNDPDWNRKKSLYQPNAISDTKKERYREWEFLKYWFRAVEKYAPWVNKVFFVTDHQVPSWMNLDCPKLVHINHEDYIPRHNLPLFNSSAIEIAIHEIPGLADNFVFFNDDMFLTQPISEDYYFIGGVPVDMAGITRKCKRASGKTFANILCNDYDLINKYFNKKEVVIGNLIKWCNPFYGRTFLRTLVNMWRPAFDGIVIPHLSVPYRKNDFLRVWEKENILLSKTQEHRFREENDINHFLFRYWRLCVGDFIPRRSTGAYIPLRTHTDIDAACDAIIHRRYPEVCLNDNWNDDGFEIAKKKLQDAWEVALPNKSKFEL